MMLKKEDYEEPACLLCGNKRETVPVRRVAEKLDEYLDSKDTEGAERHLKYWLSAAHSFGDARGEFSVRNEMMGLYRKLQMKNEALISAKEALRIGEEQGFMNTPGGAAAYVNAATVYDAFDMPEEALELFLKAKPVFERDLPQDSPKLGGMYNNMGLAYASLGRYDEADECFRSALAVMEKAEAGAAECAVTYLNMADAVYAEKGAEDSDACVQEYLDKAELLMDDPALERNGYYAFFCEKCAPVFDFYGRFFYAAQLRNRATEIYGRLREVSGR